jgi:uncharacterized protein (TIGR02145 family)
MITASNGPTLISHLGGGCNSRFSLLGENNGFYFHGECNDRSISFSPTNTWIHLVVVYENNYIRFYKDGILINDPNSASYYNFTTSLNTQNNEIRIGHPGISGPSWPSQFYGFIDDIGFWNRALSQQEITALYTSTAGTVASLNCNGFTQSGNLYSGQAASNVSISVPYTGGNAGFYAGQTVTSTGVTGLTATLTSGTLANGSGTLNYTITGTPSGAGNATFAIGVGGQSCNLVLPVTTLSGQYLANSVFCANGPTAIVDVTNPTTGKTWMDRNLGASQVATSSTDQNAYGDLYQWGRRADGHQCRTSPTTATLSSVDQPAHGNFILAPNAPTDWRSPQNANLWQGVNGVNNPCPSGYRIPTEQELDAERLSWVSNNSLGAYSSVLKATVAGGRAHNNGSIIGFGTNGGFWASTVIGTYTRAIDFDMNNSYFYNGLRAGALSVRCIKEIVGSVGALNCNGNVQTGNLIVNQAASNVSVSVPYTAGNGGYYNAQTVSSAGVTGLTLSLNAGNLANGNGNISYAVTGTPSASGSANFAISLGGQNCTLTLNVFGVQPSYPAGTVNCNGNATIVNDVTNPTTGKTWMDRNLGASQVATSSTDQNAYGDLYQWGRRADGHQCRTSPTTATLSSIDQPAHGNFIIAPNAPYDWRAPQNANLWQGINGVNNPCPSGYRIPTEQELDAERLSWVNQNSAGAYASPLKFTVTGYRNYSAGLITDNGIAGDYWTNLVNNSDSRFLAFGSNVAYFSSGYRSSGFAIRCIKETVGSVGALNCNGFTQSGNLYSGQAASNVSINVPYSGGNGGYYAGQNASSTGVTGLTATLTSGTLANGSGTLSYTITGTPSGVGNATFAINIGGQSCNLVVPITALTGQYPANSVFCANGPTAIVDVTNPTTGKIWMDRNLGASQVATSSTDQNAYGDLYQWGRRADGHQCRTSATTATLSSVDQPAHGNFIVVPNVPSDWRSPQNANLWQGVNGVNNPCPSGYRIPTETEINAERISWSQNNSVGAFSSPLKWTLAGRRFSWDGLLSDIGTYGSYWSSTISGIYSLDLDFSISSAGIPGNNSRADGGSVRCIKETVGSVGALNCNGSTQTGNLIINQTATSISASVPYTSGNGGVYNAQTLSSTGVTGLTATLVSGTLANGSGSLTYAITGTPTTSGTASFAISIGGQSCTLNLVVYGAQPSYPAGTVNCNGNATIVNDVTNPTTGKTWMDRNLGASQVATSSTDQNAYGDLYQWGRRADGHQCRTSATTSTLSSVDQPAHGNFILAPNAPFDWRSPQNANLWQGVNGVNNPCPSGYRIPTEQELDAERLSWSANNSIGAFNSPLKITLAGNRGNGAGSLFGVGGNGNYWSSVISSTSSRYLLFDGSLANMTTNIRGLGFSLRCIKETVGSVGALNCNGTTLSGGVYANQAILGTTASVPYTGGNGGYIAAQTLNSTGVTGITATLSQGLLANGAGTLAFALSGTPSGTGTATFALTIGGQSCSFTVSVQSFASLSINTNDTICNGTSTTLTASVANAGTSCAAPGMSGTLTNGLVGYWPFCGNANDLSGNANHGTVHGATLTTDRFGTANSAYSFDGIQSNIVVLNPVNLPIGNSSRTFACWFNYNTSIQPPIYNDWNSLICYGNFGANCNANYLLLNNNQTIGYAGCSGLTTSSANILNSWHQVSSTYSNGEVKIYLDGQLLSQTNNNSHSTSLTDLYFGLFNNQLNSSQKYNLNGKLDDIGIWNRALTQQEITQLYQQGQATYLWSNGATTPSITVSPTQTTTYTCTVTMNGAITTQSQTITVNPIPTVNAGQDQTVFAGTQVTLSGSGANSYAWNNGVTNNTPFTATTTTTYTVTGTTNGCAGTDQVLVTVLPAPNLTLNTNDTICNGTSTTLTASVANAGTSCAAPGLSGTLTNGLVGYWPFCGNANDLSGNANHGSFTGLSCIGCSPVTAPPTPTFDRFNTSNSSYQFSNSFDLINIPNSNSLQLTNEFTISIWANPNTGSYGSGPSYLTLLQKWGGTGSGASYMAALNPSGNPILYTNNGVATSSIVANNPISLNNWTLITFTFENGLAKIFLNGILNTSSANLVVPAIQNSSIEIARNLNQFANFSGDAFAGILDDIGLWNRALTQQEITQLYQQGQATYLWSNGATTPSITVSPTQTTTYTCTVTMNGVSTTQSQTITVNALPTVTATANQTVCAGASVTLNGSGASSYSWNNGISNGVAFTPNSTTTYTVTGTNANGCTNTAQTTVTVNALPAANITAQGATTFCQNNSVTLNANSGAGLSYQWYNNGSAINGANSATLPVSNAGSYTVQVTNANNCSQTSAATSVTVNALPAATITPASATTFCQGGSVVLNGNVGQGLSYQWNLNGSPINGANAASYTANASGNYSLDVLNSDGCSATATVVSVTVNALPTVSAGTNQTLCAGTAITLSGSGASSYTWNNGVSNGVSFTPVSTQTYTVTGTNANGCSNTAQVTVTVNALPTPTISYVGSPILCQGSTLALNSSAGSSYLWSNGQTTQTIQVTQGGAYTVQVTNANGCVGTSNPVNITVNPLPAPSITAQGPTTFCQGGSVVLTSTGATSYAWSTNATTQSITVTTSGLYQVTVVDNKGCSGSSSPIQVTVLSPPNASITTIGSTALCAGQSTSLSAPAGNTYLWSNGASTQNITVNTAGTYSVQVTNAAGCSANSNVVTISVNPVPVANISANGATSFCSGGSVVLTASAGASYLWNTGATTQSITVNSSGTFNVTVTGAGGCNATSAATSVTVNALPTASITASGNTTFCAGNSVLLSASNGNSYLWSNGATTPSISATTAGSYSVSVTNGAGCSATSTPVQITVNPLPTVSAGANQSVCIGGQVTLNGSGANTYTWNNGVTNGIAFTPANTQTYTVTGTNANGCSNTAQVTVTVNALPAVSAGANQSICAGSQVTLMGSGANTYAWNNGVTNGVAFTPVNTQTYTVTGTNANGCSNTAQMTVTVNALPTASISPSGSTTLCAGSSVNLSASNGSSYLWSNGATTQTITASSAGNYSVQVTNAAGCSATSSIVNVVVNPLPAANITANGSTTFCAGGSVVLSATAGASYLWNTGATSQTLTVNTSGTYTVTVTSNNGCVGTSSPQTVTVSAQPSTSITANGATSFCAGGSVLLSAPNGGTYLWSTGATTPSISVSTAGNYSVTVTNGAGCSATSSPTQITVNPLPVVSAGANQSVCSGAQVTLNGSGATSYIWNNGVTNGVAFTPATTQTYTVTGSDANGCSNTAQVTVSVNALPVVSAGANQSICSGAQVTLNGSGATSYTWNNGVTNGVAFTPANTQTYTVTGTNANGCANTAQVTVSVNALPAVSAGANQSICAGAQVTLNGSGATSYAWNNGVTNGVAFTPANTQTYTVTGTNANGCSNTAQVTVSVNVLPTVSAGANQSVCAGNQVTLNGSGATSYSWNNGVTNGVAFTPANTQTYTVTGTNANGCSNTAQVTVTVNALPVVSAGSNQSVCAGNQVTLNGSGATSYAWNNGVTNGVAFTPANTQTYTVTGTNANGCTNTAQVTVTVNALPTANAGTNALINCVNNPNGALLGAAPQAGFTYQWSPATGLSSATLANPVANPINSTGYTLTVTQTATGCSNTASVNVTVNSSAPQANAGQNSSITCVANTNGVNIGSNPSAGLTYAWTPSTGLSASNISNPVANPLLTTTYTLTITNTSNGCTGTGTVTVSVNNTAPTVNAGQDQTVCAGQSVTLNATGANTYTWNNGAIQGVAFTPSTTQTYTVQGTNTVNGCTSTDQVIVTLNALPTVSAGTNQTVCAGTSVTLTGSGASSYAWNNGVSNGVAFSPTNTQTYTVTGTDANGCSNTAQVTVTVNALPVVSAGPNQSICAGTAVTLNGSGATNYTWNNGVSNGVAFTPTNTQTYTVTGTNANGCQGTAQVTVTVNAVPTPTLVANGTAPYCPGTNVVLSTPSIPGHTYQWYFGQNIINGATASTYTATTAGTYYVKVTAPGGCFGNSNSITISYLNPTIIAMGPTNICQGGNVVLQTAVGAGFQYTWMKNGMSLINGGNSASFTASSPGTYTVKIVTPSGCVMYSNPIQVSFIINPTASITANGSLNLCAGNSITLSAANNANAVSYQWRKNGINILGATSQTLVVSQSGTYSVVIANLACPATSAVISNTLTIQVFPNPNPIITSSGTVVSPGVSVTLSTATGIGNTYQWYKMLGTTLLAIQGATQATYTTTSSGTFRVKVTNMYGCWKYSNSITIGSSQLPEQGVTCTSDGIVVKHPEGISNEGTWMEEAVDGTKSRITTTWDEANKQWVVMAKPQGNYVYETTEEEMVMQWIRIVNVCNERTLVAYPNPTRDVFTVDGITQIEAVQSIQLWNQMGQRVTEFAIETQHFDLSNYAPGLYFLVIEALNERIQVKVERN